MTTPFASLRHHWPSRAAAALCVTATIGPLAPFATAAPASPSVQWRSDSLRPTDTWNTLSLQMNVSRRRVTKSGDPIGAPAPSTAYRIERSSRTGSWKTVITVLGVDAMPAYSLAGTLLQRSPFPAARIEDDEDGTPVRVYDASGRRLVGAPAAAGATATATSALPRSAGRTWIEAFVASAAQKNKRMQDFERQFGKGAKAGALTRFLRKDIDSSQELFVDTKTVVPIESKALRGIRLTTRHTFAYAPAPDGAVVRTAVHTEAPVSLDSSDLAIVDTAFSNIRLELRR